VTADVSAWAEAPAFAGALVCTLGAPVRARAASFRLVRLHDVCNGGEAGEHAFVTVAGLIIHPPPPLSLASKEHQSCEDRLRFFEAGVNVAAVATVPPRNAAFALAQLLSRRGLERPCETLVAWAQEA
jgi:hypothetical protein